MEEDMLILKYGGRWDIWQLELPAISRFVERHAPDLVRMQIPGQALAAVNVEKVAAPPAGKVMIWDPRFGGMMMPHIHYNGEIFALNQEQWSEFSNTAVASLAAKLGKAKNITFAGLMDVSKAVTRV